MRIFLFIIFTICSFDGISQFPYCDSLVVKGHYIPIDTTNVRFTSNYIENKYSSLAEHIIDRRELNSIPLWFNNNEGHLLFNDYPIIDIRITIKKKKIVGEKYFYPKEKEDNYSSILEDYRIAPYGITSEDTIVKYISNITINNSSIPDSVFNDLINPNCYETYKAIKPITSYYSKDKKYIFIYIFGKLSTTIKNANIASNFSYMAKLIFDINGKYIGRIVERGEYLNLFGFNKCPDFVGF